jgi:starch synthase
MKKLKIISISSELSPFSKTGGLADVARSLPKALKRLGHEVVAVTPFYGQIIDPEKHNLKLVFANEDIVLNSEETLYVNIWQGYLMDDLPVYFIENHKYFSKRKTVYGSGHENARFALFCAASLKLIHLLEIQPDIIHCHDWHTGLIPFYIKNKFHYAKNLLKAKTVYTIHNLVFQFGRNWWEVPAEKKDFGRGKIPRLSDPDIEYVNFAKRAILSADIINTVSEQYREEIMTRKFGQDLHRILKNRSDRLFGIVNGIDYNTFNPEKDEKIFKNYIPEKVHRKILNKEELQKTLGLKIDKNEPLMCFTSRVTFQKGFELILEAIPHLLEEDRQLAIMGDGDKSYISELKKYQKRYPHRLVWLPFQGNEHLETLIYAGSDIFLLPSHHEPCGINQLIAMRYGTIPVARRVGGLHDTIENFNPSTNRGTGFVFNDFNVFSFFEAVIRALENYKHRDVWRALSRRAMQKSSSWEIPAKKYVVLYKKALKQ